MHLRANRLVTLLLFPCFIVDPVMPAFGLAAARRCDESPLFRQEALAFAGAECPLSAPNAFNHHAFFALSEQRDYAKPSTSAAPIGYDSHEAAIDRLLQDIFETRVSGFMVREVNWKELAPMLVYDFLRRGLHDEKLAELFRALVEGRLPAGPHGRAPGIFYIVRSPEALPEHRFSVKGHASDRGIYLFMDRDEYHPDDFDTAQRVADVLMHEYAAFLGLPPSGSNALEVVRQAWAETGQPLEQLFRDPHWQKMYREENLREAGGQDSLKLKEAFVRANSALQLYQTTPRAADLLTEKSRRENLKRWLTREVFRREFIVGDPELEEILAKGFESFEGSEGFVKHLLTHSLPRDDAPKHRRVFELIGLQGMTRKQAAERLNISSGLVNRWEFGTSQVIRRELVIYWNQRHAEKALAKPVGTLRLSNTRTDRLKTFGMATMQDVVRRIKANKPLFSVLFEKASVGQRIIQLVESRGYLDLAIPPLLDPLDESVDTLGLSLRTSVALRRALPSPINTIRELIALTREDMAAIAGLGEKAANEIIETLHNRGLKLADASESETRTMLAEVHGLRKTLIGALIVGMLAGGIRSQTLNDSFAERVAHVEAEVAALPQLVSAASFYKTPETRAKLDQAFETSRDHLASLLDGVDEKTVDPRIARKLLDAATALADAATEKAGVPGEWRHTNPAPLPKTFFRGLNGFLSQQPTKRAAMGGWREFGSAVAARKGGGTETAMRGVSRLTGINRLKGVPKFGRLMKFLGRRENEFWVWTYIVWQSGDFRDLERREKRYEDSMEDMNNAANDATEAFYKSGSEDVDAVDVVIPRAKREYLRALQEEERRKLGDDSSAARRIFRDQTRFVRMPTLVPMPSRSPYKARGPIRLLKDKFKEFRDLRRSA